MPLSNLAVDTFLVLREEFFDRGGVGKLFNLRDKRNTQDDPLDEYIVQILRERLVHSSCQKSSGPLISPDMVIFRSAECSQAPRRTLKNDISRIFGLEVKKLERGKSGQVARPTGLDYNTTPPCGTIRIYDTLDQSIDIRSFYLFVCLERADEQGNVFLSALTLCDGNILNADFDFYLSITGQRTKGIGLGTYADDMNRNRPMLVFANPLGAPQFDRAVTLIIETEITKSDSNLGLVYEVGRTVAEGGTGNIFQAYRHIDDIPEECQLQRLLDPFPKPINRLTTTQGRGKFRLPIVTVNQETNN